MKSTLARHAISGEPRSGMPQTRAAALEAGVRPSAFAGFLIGSFVAHGVADAALSGLPQEPSQPPRLDEVEFVMLAPTEEAEPVVVPPAPTPAIVPPAPRLRPSPRPAKTEPPSEEAAQAVSEPAPAAEPGPLPLDLGVTSATGLGVAGTEGSGARNGTGTGTGTGVVTASRSVDLRPIAAEWVRKVNLAIAARALRDYPRSALRAQLQGSVLLAVQVDIHGRLAGVELKQSSGHPQLDEAAVAAARALGELPAPPEALHGQLRPLRIPVNYRVQ